MIENLKIGRAVSKNQLSRILNEGLATDNVLDEPDVMKGLACSIGDWDSVTGGASENG